jgi:signal transduction histidine kinase/CheY-like chemotaxis protein
MSPYAFSQAFLSGFFAFAALSSFALWQRRRRDWTLLLLAGVCAIGSIQTVATLVLATAENVNEAREAQRVRGLCGLMSFASLAWLFAGIARVRARPYLWFVTATALAVAVVAVLGIPLLGTVTGITRVLLPWGEPFSLLQRSRSSPLVAAVYAVMFSTVVFNVACARRLMSHDRVSGVLLTIATLGSVVPLVSGALVDITSAPIPYIGTLGIAAFVLVIALQLAVGRRRDEELLAAERAQRSLEQRLAQAQKMEALGQLAGGIAHDFNNILTVIAGHADMVLTTAGPESRLDLEQIRLACTRAAAMTGQLLAFSRQSIMQPAIVSLNAVVASTETMLRRTIGEHIELVVRLAPDLWNVEADPNQCGRALVNVAINARDAMPAGGCLTIETANVLKDESVSLDPASAPMRYVMVSVADTGQGMTPETKARLLEPFFTTKEFGKGTGLGLAVVDGIVRQTGGHVDVDSEPGHGTVFRMFFPATDRRPSGEVPREDAESRLRGSETVLLVEDDPGVRSLTRIGLERYGYCVLAAADGDEAVRVARQHGRPIDLVVTDVLMPGSTGPQTVARLREGDPSLAALFISGYTADALPHEATTGEAAFLQKPFTPAVLAARMRSILDA